MISTATRNLYFPEDEQTLLLSASLSRGENALRDWKLWRSSVDVEDLDPESHALLGALYQNLAEHEVDDPEMDRLRGIYKRTWLANQLAAKQLCSVLQALQQRGIETIVLGDAALVVNCCQDYGRELIKHFDLLVPAEETERATELLKNSGWLMTEAAATNRRGGKASVRFFRDDAQQWLHLHHELFWAIPQEHVNHQLRTCAVRGEMCGLEIRFLSPTDQFLYSCQRSFLKRRHWQMGNLTDVMLILHSATERMDWIRMVAQAQRYELILPLRNMLTLVEEIVRFPIPGWVSASLRKMAISHAELLDYQMLPEQKTLIFKGHVLKSWYALENYAKKVSGFVCGNGA